MSAYLNGKKVGIAYASNPNLDTLRENVANAFKGKVVGKNTVRLDDVSPIPHTIGITLSPYNLIDQEEFFGANSYTISGTVGETYILKPVFKEGVTSGGYIAEIDENGTLTTFGFGGGNPKEYSVEITEGHTYSWSLNEGTFNDIYESVSMVLESVDDVTLTQYGKNLIDYDVNTAKWEVAGNGRAFYFDAPCVSTFSIKRTEDKGTIILERSTDNFVTDDTNVAQASAGKEFTPCVITPGYKYRVYTTKTTVDGKFIEWMQLEVGTSTEYEKYKEPINGAESIYPTTTLVADTTGVTIEATYNRDINKALAELKNAILNLGGTI